MPDAATQREHYMNSVPDEREVNEIFQECISKAETTFGELSSGWQYIVQLRDPPSRPETVTISTNQVIVWLNKGRSRVGYLFEAGHEAVHCLNPSIVHSTYLEEAVATAFSQCLVFDQFGQPGLEKVCISKHYRHALNLAGTIDRDVVSLGVRLRDHVGSLREVPPEALRELYPQAPDLTVQQILGMFPR